jgi:hypothetical protein
MAAISNPPRSRIHLVFIRLTVPRSIVDTVLLIELTVHLALTPASNGMHKPFKFASWLRLMRPGQVSARRTGVR